MNEATTTLRLQQAGNALERSLQAVQRASENASAQASQRASQALDGAARLGRQAAGHVKEQPLKAALISAAVGIAAVGLVALLGGRRGR